MIEKSVIEKAKGLHGSIAQDVFPNGARLHCSVCDKEIDITTEECAHYLGHGWPMCCGYAMTMEKTK